MGQMIARSKAPAGVSASDALPSDAETVVTLDAGRDGAERCRREVLAERSTRAKRAVRGGI